jgi:nitrate reductase gamma subunit
MPKIYSWYNAAGVLFALALAALSLIEGAWIGVLIFAGAAVLWAWRATRPPRHR